ncbi:MAG: hypothetical protein LBH03_05120 [Holophagales bacterium]|jgi:hypothetical protein|nr:hypothetical protein [Holophagales bacterium]
MSELHFSAVGVRNALAQPAKLMGQSLKNALASAVGLSRPSDNEPLVSISQEARLLLQTKKETDRERMKKAIDEERANHALFQDLQKTSKQNHLSQKIADTKQRLKMIVDSMRTAIMMGDKHMAAMLAKEAAQIAKDLAVAVKSATGGHASAGEAISIPNVDAGGDGEEQTAGAEGGNIENVDNVENIENIDSETPEAEIDGTEKAAARAAAIEAKAESDAVDDQTDDDQRDENDESDNRKKVIELKGQTVVEKLKAMREEVLNKVNQTREGSLTPDQKKDLREIKMMLKTITSMAKSLLKQNPRDGLPENSQQLDALQKEFEKADDEIGAALKDVDDALAA